MEPEHRPGGQGAEASKASATLVSKHQSTRKSHGTRRSKKSNKPPSTRYKRKSETLLSPAECFISPATMSPPISKVTSDADTINKEPSSHRFSTTDRKLTMESATNKLTSPLKSQLAADTTAENDVNEKADAPASKWSAAATQRVLSVATSTVAQAKSTVAANRATTIVVSIMTILVITTVGFIYLFPLYNAGKRRLGTLDSSDAATNMPACVDQSSQLTLELGEGKLFGLKSVKTERSGLSVRQFFGIHYGASTAGKGRFGPAVPAPPLSVNTTLQAYTHGPPCAQMAFNASEPEGSEDCLKLSIWAPFTCRPTDPLKKVVIVLPSDWFQTGRVADYDNIWRTLSANGDLVVVAPNVRLGVLGYLSSTSEQAPGNVAFTDVSVALSWIRAYIAAFHGNPTEIVALGLGAGSLILSTVFLSTPDSNTYIQRLIVHGLSPTSLLPRNGAQNAISLGNRLACTDTNDSIDSILTCLRTRDWKDVLVKSRSFSPFQFVPSRDISPMALFGSSLDNAVGRSLSGVSILCGYYRKEGHQAVTSMLKSTTAPESSVPEAVFARIARFFAGTNESAVFEHLSAKAKALLEGLDEYEIHQLLVDAIYHCPLEELAAVATQKLANVWFYVITDTGDSTPDHYITQMITFIKTGAMEWAPFGSNENILLVNSTATNYPVSKWRTELCLTTREIANALAGLGVQS